jgi:hypothetical protein
MSAAKYHLSPATHRRQSLSLWMLALAWSLTIPSLAQAQMFGNRSVGAPLNSASQRQNGNNAAAGVGMLNGSERFLRGNRSRRDYVGSDRNELRGFVGSEQALGVGTVRSATEGLRIDTVNTARINQPLPPQPTKGLYYPRLEIDFRVPSARASRGENAPDAAIRDRVARIAGERVRLSLQGNVAILSGTVDSQRKSELLAAILSFEPGIEQVQNDLIIN